MDKWEYKVLFFESEQIVRECGGMSIKNAEVELNKLGNEGWEVVSATGDGAFRVLLKRRK